MNLSGRPAFIQRDLFRRSWLLPADHGRFAARNRINRDGGETISMAYGGEVSYGPPFFVHTFDWYFPAKEYFDKHPEFYAVKNGKRVPGNKSQLCLTNPGMRREMLRKLKKFITDAKIQAAERNTVPPLIYDISINDTYNPCECQSCQALAKQEKSESGPVIDLINEMTNGIREEHPDIYISTLAYYHTEEPPRNLRPGANVIIRLCDTRTNQAQPFSAPENRHFQQLVSSWARIAENLGIWDYSITYHDAVGPYPHESTLVENIRFLRENHVKFMFFEHENIENADMHTMNVWLEAKLMENPGADYAGLLNTFMTLYYQEAAPEITAYRELIRKSVGKHRPYLDWFALPAQFTHIDLETAVKAQALFDQAESQTTGRILNRVRRARLNLDRICNIRSRLLIQEHVAGGGSVKSFPLNIDSIAQRARDTWLHALDSQFQQQYTEKYRKDAEKEFAANRNLPLLLEEPAEFGGQVYYDYNPIRKLNIKYQHHKRVADPEAESGYAVKVEADKKPAFYQLPLVNGMYYITPRRNVPGTPLVAPKIPGPGYHWYQVNHIRVSHDAYLYVPGDWTIQFPLKATNAGEGTECQVWLRLKFTGPAYPHGKTDEPNAIYLERMILLKQ